MKRWVVVVVGISLVLFGLTSLIGRQGNDLYGLTPTQKGWPVVYEDTGDLSAAVCPGINGVLANNSSENQSEDQCSGTGESNQPVRLVLDFIFWLAICSVAGYGLYTLRRRKP